MTDDEFNDYVEILNDDNFKGRTLHTPKSLVHQIYELNEKVKQLTRELDEQARLNGMGAERELKLMAKLAAAERKVEKLREALEFYSNRMTYVARSGMECAITRDHFGDRARAALNETEKTDE